MLIKIIKSVFNFYMLCVQPVIGLVLAGYGAWKFSGAVSQHYWNQHRTLSLELLFCLYGI